MTSLTNLVSLSSGGQFAMPLQAIDNPSALPTPSISETTLKERITFSKLDKVEVFDQMRSKICLVNGKNGRTSGFFINKEGLLVTAFHCLSTTTLPNNQFSVNPDELTVAYCGRNYSVGFPPGFNASRAKELDLCLLKIKCEESVATDYFELLPSFASIKEGMKTYFAGFPLTQTSITFHTGSISSIFEKNNAKHFTIDGTVVPGNSGGPVIIQNECNLYLAGVIFAEVVDIEPRFLQAQAHLKPLLDQATIQVGGVRFNQLLSQVIETMFSNMSTGIGKAIHSRHLYELCDHQVTVLPQPASFAQIDGTELPVMKKRALEKELQEYGWSFLRNGGSHEIWTNGTDTVAVPRHTEIKNGTALAILEKARENPRP